jgi:hypothetical protein
MHLVGPYYTETSTNFSIPSRPEYTVSRKSVHREPSFVHVDTWTDIMTRLMVAFHNFSNGSKRENSC